MVVDDSVDSQWMSLSPPGTTVHKMWTSCVRRKMPRSDYPKSLVRRGARAYKSSCRRTMADRPKATSAAEGRAGKPVKPAGSDDPGGDESRRARHASDRDRRSRRDARGPLNLIHSAGLVAFCCPGPSLPGTDTANPLAVSPKGARRAAYRAGGAEIRGRVDATSPKRSSYVAHWVRAWASSSFVRPTKFHHIASFSSNGTPPSNSTRLVDSAASSSDSRPRPR